MDSLWFLLWLEASNRNAKPVPMEPVELSWSLFEAVVFVCGVIWLAIVVHCDRDAASTDGKRPRIQNF